MKTQIIEAKYLKTICWNDNIIVDWAAGIKYFLNGKVKQFGYRYAFAFDSAISSPEGSYAFIYQKLGTKGLLLKNGKLIREINRSYYCANAYGFPAAFIKVKNRTYLIHCPVNYNQLDFEDIETGEVVTNIKERKPDDRFHSRLEVSPDGKFLMSKGWVWHPLEQVMVFDIAECIRNPLLLDNPQFYPKVGVEICTASFINDNTIVIGSSDVVFDDDKIEKLPSKHICMWNLKTDELSKPVKVKEDFGNLYAINVKYAWDLFRFPKIINLNTGEIIEQNKAFKSGKQQSSIINVSDDFPSIIFNRQSKQIAMILDEKIEILTMDANLE